ncbi:uracil-DNA glycosylase family protein [Acinetobacter sp. MD2]|uniref:uracil-DNA glycosylase family protein n=1 Tax=Acinetobacter sp. MD2 TaxID=2600066 RepID=UPI002D1F7564|nr:uracil-DNA glycosylase family protein [Acinetobacter sp. MD2]MEB3766603.1 uracil-DNA glycosylase family protein [Acinetobacter sp. MD2]
MSEQQIETHPLPPFLPTNAQLLMVGSFPPPQSKWKMDFYYPNFQNDMWRIMGLLFFQDKNHFLDLTNKQFKLTEIKAFLEYYGIAIYDTAYQVIRQKGNASDQFLEVMTPSPLLEILEKIPNCYTIMTTGEKATDTLMLNFSPDTQKPTLNQPSLVQLTQKTLHLYRLPSSSRAYPLALEKKAECYANFFRSIGMLN